MGQYSAALLDEILRGISPIPAFKWTVDSAIYWFSMGPLSSGTYGPFYDRVKEWSGFRNGTSIINPSLEGPNGSVAINDPDGMLSKIIATHQGSLRSSKAEIIWASDNDKISTSDWFTYFTGEVERVIYQDRVWIFRLRTADQVLKGNAALPYVTPEVFPTADDGSYGQPIPVIYGLHGSTNLGVTGMLPAIHCATDGADGDSSFPYRYVFSVGRTSWKDGAVGGVWADGVSAGTQGVDYSYKWSTRSGHWFSEVGFPSDQRPKKITLDFGGMSRVASGSHAAANFIENACEAIVHFLTNFVFNSWDGLIVSGDGAGGWFTAGTDSPIDTGSVDAVGAWLRGKGHRGSRRIVRDISGRIVNDMLHDNQLNLWWNEKGMLEFGVNDPHTEDVYLSSVTGWRPWLDDADFRSVPEIDFDPSEQLREVAGEYLYASSEDEFKRSMRAVNPFQPYGRVETMQLYWRESKE